MRIELAAAFVEHLAKKESSAVGFLPRTIYPKAIQEGRCQIAEANGEAAGFFLQGNWAPVTRIYQTAVTEEERLQDCARSMFHRMRLRAVELGVQAIELHCADELPANAFWHALGFVAMGRRMPKTLNRRWATRWRWQLPEGEAVETYLENLHKNEKELKILKLLGAEQGYIDCMKKRFVKKLWSMACVTRQLKNQGE